MQRKNNTFMRKCGTVIVFAAFMGIFAGIAVLLMFVGIYWAFQLFFSATWWVGLLVFGALLVAYIMALRFGLKLLRKENE